MLVRRAQDNNHIIRTEIFLWNRHIKWKLRMALTPTLSSFMTLYVVITIKSGAAGEDKIGIIAICGFQFFIYWIMALCKTTGKINWWKFSHLSCEERREMYLCHRCRRLTCYNVMSCVIDFSECIECFPFCVVSTVQISRAKWHMWPLLLTWFNFNPSMDK